MFLIDWLVSLFAKGLVVIILDENRNSADWAGIMKLLNPIIDTLRVENVLVMALQLRYFVVFLKLLQTDGASALIDMHSGVETHSIE